MKMKLNFRADDLKEQIMTAAMVDTPYMDQENLERWAAMATENYEYFWGDYDLFRHFTRDFMSKYVRMKTAESLVEPMYKLAMALRNDSGERLFLISIDWLHRIVWNEHLNAARTVLKDYRDEGVNLSSIDVDDLKTIHTLFQKSMQIDPDSTTRYAYQTGLLHLII